MGTESQQRGSPGIWPDSVSQSSEVDESRCHPYPVHVAGLKFEVGRAEHGTSLIKGHANFHIRAL